MSSETFELCGGWNSKKVKSLNLKFFKKKNFNFNFMKIVLLSLTFSVNFPHRISIKKSFLEFFALKIEENEKFPSHFSSKICFVTWFSGEKIMWWWSQNTKRTRNFEFITLKRFQLSIFISFSLKLCFIAWNCGLVFTLEDKTQPCTFRDNVFASKIFLCD